MQKLLITCQCGQQMQAPRSALGKMGRCSTCGHTTRITAANTQPLGGKRRPVVYGPRPAAEAPDWRHSPGASTNAKVAFGQAVDHFYAGRYGESLALFDSLDREFPGDPEIEKGREECLKAIRRPQAALPHLDGSAAARTPEAGGGVLDVETIRKVVLERLLYSTSESVQIQAAELAMRLLGIYGADNGQAAQTPAAAVAESPLADTVSRVPGDQLAADRPSAE